MITDHQLETSFNQMVSISKFSIPANRVQDLFQTLSRIAPTCMVDPSIAKGFVNWLVEQHEALTPTVVTELAHAELALRDLKAQPVQVQEGLSLPEHLEMTEKELIQRALTLHRKKGDAAEALGIPQSTLSTKLRKFGLMDI
ncbi:MAG: hypothetical protein KIT79_05180 [Deltaproteobacteria bacterium]|nr:hypothetical protein [Deltaproteobacteria bacterium]